MKSTANYYRCLKCGTEALYTNGQPISCPSCQGQYAIKVESIPAQETANVH